MRGLADAWIITATKKIKTASSNFSANITDPTMPKSWKKPGGPTAGDAGLPLITVKALENVIANDKNLSGMKLNASELLDLSFLEQLAQERKAKGAVARVSEIRRIFPLRHSGQIAIADARGIQDFE